MLTVGITFFLHKGGKSIWTNGGIQHCAFLWLLLRAAGHNVIAINGGDGDSSAPPPMLARLGIKFVPITDDVLDQLDVLIEAGAQVGPSHVERVHAHGGKAVTFKYGNAYVIDNERIVHRKSPGSIFNGSRFDEVWTNPQHVRTCASYWETCYRCPVRVLPNIWEPIFVDAARAEFPPELTFGYQPGRTKKRVVILEPNHNIVKTCTIPMLACENAYRDRPDLIDKVYVENAEHLKSHLTFERFAANLDIVKARSDDGHGICTFEARHNTPWFLAKFGDVVVSHQWENALNYAYYETLYGGYPLVHNSDMLPEGIGYRYDGFDAHAGGRALVAAALNHDASVYEYFNTALNFLATVRASAPANVEAHERALTNLSASPRTP